MPATETVNIRLLFPGQIKARLKALSESIHRIAPSQYVLGTATPAHVTLLAFDYDGRDIRLEPRIHAVSLAGLATMNDKDGMVFVTAAVRKTPELEKLREEILAACGNPRLPRKTFDPHVTLARIAAADVDKVTAARQDNPAFHLPHIPCKTSGVIFSPETGYRLL